MTSADTPVAGHRILPRERWLEERKAFLIDEKRVTRQRDELARRRRELPWVKVEKDYIFDTPQGKQSLADLFDGRSQLLIKHFMLGPGWQEGCVGCSFECDHLDATVVHLHHHDVTVVAVARAPLAEIEPFHRRMGWRFRWISSFGSDFNYDYHISFTPAEIATGKVYDNYAEQDFQSEESSGLSVFYKDAAGDVYHTYSAYGRGAEELLGTYVILDLTPKGRNETGPNHNLTDWVRHHDCYDAGGYVDATGRYRANEGSGCSSCSEEASA